MLAHVQPGTCATPSSPIRPHRPSRVPAPRIAAANSANSVANATISGVSTTVPHSASKPPSCCPELGDPILEGWGGSAHPLLGPASVPVADGMVLPALEEPLVQGLGDQVVFVRIGSQQPENVGLELGRAGGTADADVTQPELPVVHLGGQQAGLQTQLVEFSGHDRSLSLSLSPD